MFNEHRRSKLVVAWRNGAGLCGDATLQGISKAECVNDAQERLIICWSNALFFHAEVFQSSSFLMSVLSIVRNLRIAAISATFFSFPFATRCR